MRKGYSILELILIFSVILILGAFALIVINPHELSTQKRDAERKKLVTKVGTALIGYADSKNGLLPHEDGNWLSDLYARGELDVLPKLIIYDNPEAVCKKNQKSGICYDTDGKLQPTQAIVYTKLESISENTKCNVSLGETAWQVYDMLNIRSGLVCTVGVEPIFNPDGQDLKY